MASARFLEVLKFTLDILEGYGFSDRSTDPGGKTRAGVIQSTFSGWLHSHGHGDREVSTMTDDERDAIYDELYWQTYRCEELPPDFDLVMFAAAINLRAGAAIKLLQAILEVDVDGAFGPKTLEGVMNSDPATLSSRFLDSQLGYIVALRHPEQGGLINRVAKVRAKLNS